MKINYKKTKVMLFNQCKNWDFMPLFELEGKELEVVDEMKMLGIIVRSDMKWSSNTKYIVKKGYSRLWILRRLKALGAGPEDLKDVFLKQVRSVLELAVPAWHPGLTQADSLDIERVQKAALYIILGEKYTTYSSALKATKLECLAARRSNLCIKFAKKAVQHKKHTNWFKTNDKVTVTRFKQPKLCPVIARTKRFEKSPLSYLTKLLNKYYLNK